MGLDRGTTGVGVRVTVGVGVGVRNGVRVGGPEEVGVRDRRGIRVSVRMDGERRGESYGTRVWVSKGRDSGQGRGEDAELGLGGRNGWGKRSNGHMESGRNYRRLRCRGFSR